MTDPNGTPNFVPKRFYACVDVADTGRGYAILLDRRPVRTPAKAELLLPTDPLAAAVAEEWRNQKEFINPATMPLTRLANTTIDGVVSRIDEVRADAAGYAATDLLCYRAEGPENLAARQAVAWDPVIAAVEDLLGVRFVVTRGIMPAGQSHETLAKVADWFSARDAFSIAALHVVTTVSGSCLLAIALAERHTDIETLWQCALVDEDYQMELWGRDEEAMKMREHRWRDIEAAARLLQLLSA